MLARILLCQREPQQQRHQIVGKAYVSVACVSVSVDDLGRRTMTNPEAYASQAQVHVETKQKRPQSAPALGRNLACVNWHFNC